MLVMAATWYDLFRVKLTGERRRAGSYGVSLARGAIGTHNSKRLPRYDTERDASHEPIEPSGATVVHVGYSSLRGM